MELGLFEIAGFWDTVRRKHRHRGNVRGLLVLLSILAAATAGASAGPELEILFTKSVPQAQQEILKQDILSLQDLPFSSLDGKMEGLFHIERGSSTHADLNRGLIRWLAERAHYIVGESYSVDSGSLRVSQGQIRYTKPSLLPDFLVQAKDLLLAPVAATMGPESAGGTVLMSNIGGLIFGIGKARGEQILADLEDYGWKPAKSSQFGIFKIGARLFPAKQSGSSEFVPRIHRLMTLFHEARHGDGSGRTMLFPHVRCPQGHDYEGLMACDLPSNGAYAIGAQFLASVKEACTQCSPAEREVMRVLLADHQNRVLGVSGFQFEWDEKPEVIENEQQ